MTSYFSTLLTTTTSRVATLKQTLLSSEADGDTEDDTHLCRVLRAYYTEKGRSFPAWLPPDPKAPPPPVVQPVYSNSNVGRGYGGLSAGGQGGATGERSGGSLSSLWDSQPQNQTQQDAGSLRQGRGAVGGRQPGGGLPQQRQSPFNRQQSPQQQVQARPLPSQRAGSYQSVGRGGDTPPGSSGSGSGPAMSAQDRLKKKFNRGGSSGAMSGSDSGSFDAGRNDSYGSSRGGGGNYEDRFAPQDGGYGSRGGGAGGKGADKPFMAATSPWASNEQEFGGGGYSGGGGGGAARQGLPNGPGAGRRGPGLPSGPRGIR